MLKITRELNIPRIKLRCGRRITYCQGVSRADLFSLINLRLSDQIFQFYLSRNTEACKCGGVTEQPQLSNILNYVVTAAGLLRDCALL